MVKDISTKELVDELKTREGVETTMVEPHQVKSITTSGPAIVMVIKD